MDYLHECRCGNFKSKYEEYCYRCLRRAEWWATFWTKIKRFIKAR